MSVSVYKTFCNSIKILRELIVTVAETEIETDRQTEIQRQRDRDRDRGRQRQSDIERHRNRDREKELESVIQLCYSICLLFEDKPIAMFSVYKTFCNSIKILGDLIVTVADTKTDRDRYRQTQLQTDR